MMRRAYTIGARKPYTEALQQESAVYKIGARPDDRPPYTGGWVWRTFEEATAFIERSSLSFDAAVFELLLPSGWDSDVSSEVEVDGVHRLLHDAQITKQAS